MGSTIENLQNLADWYATEEQSARGESADVSKKSNESIEEKLDIGGITLSTTDEYLWNSGQRVKDSEGNYIIARVSAYSGVFRSSYWWSDSDRRKVESLDSIVNSINNWYVINANDYFKENGYIKDAFVVGSNLPFGNADLSCKYVKTQGTYDNYFTYIAMDSYPKIIVNNVTYGINRSWGFGNLNKDYIRQYAWINNSTHFGVICKTRPVDETETFDYYTSPYAYSVYLIEKTEQLMDLLGTNYTTEKGFIAHSDTYGDASVTQGLTGIIDTVSDNINIPLKSNKGVTGTGFVNIYEISTNQLTDFGKDMFSDIDIDFQWDTTEAKQNIAEEYSMEDMSTETFTRATNELRIFKGVFDLVKSGFKNYFTSKLIDYVLSVHIIPVNPTTSANAERINVGFKTFTQTAKRVLDDYIDYDCGTLHIPSKYKNFLDYTHTSCKLFLPFIGFVDIGSRYVYDCDVNIKYRFSVIDGTCTAFVSSSAMNGTTSIIGTYSGTCCLHIPFTGENYSQLVSSLVQTTTSVAGAVATGNFAVGMANASRPTMASVNAPTMRIAKAKDDENPIFYTTREDIASYKRALSNASNDYNNAMQNRATTIQNAKFGRNMNTANALMGNVGNVTGALSGSAMGNGSMSSSSAFMGVRRPYIIIERPIPQLPPTYFKNHGGLANITEYPKNCKGFTQCVDVQLDCNIKTDIALKLKEIMETGFIV